MKRPALASIRRCRRQLHFSGDPLPNDAFNARLLLGERT